MDSCTEMMDPKIWIVVQKLWIVVQKCAVAWLPTLFLNVEISLIYKNNITCTMYNVQCTFNH